MSLDGFIAGPNQSVEDPLGEGGTQLHEWAFALAAWRKPHGQDGGEVNASSEVLEESLENLGAAVMGRNMFGGKGAWGDEPWDGWWGDDPPFHMPVFVVTHHAREPVAKEEAPPSASSPTALNPPSSRPGKRPTARTSP
jgi:dihydrofolate reductase